jgi:hypothetical protein
MRVVSVYLCAIGLIALTTSPALSQGLFLDRSIPTPANLTEGLAWDGAALWNCDRGSDRVYQIDPSDGTILHSFASPIDNPVGLAWRPESGTIWLGATGITREVDTSGAVLKTIFESTLGLAWVGDDLYTDNGGRTITRRDEDGTELSSFLAPQPVRGLTWDGNSLWAVSFATDSLFELSLTGDLRSTTYLPDLGIHGDAIGLAWDGSGIWVSEQISSRIYRLVIPEPLSCTLYIFGLACIATGRPPRPSYGSTLRKES